MELSISAPGLISIAALIICAVLFFLALINFVKAARTKLPKHYRSAFRLSGHGFLLLGLLQLFLLKWLANEQSKPALYTSIFFLIIGALLSFISRKLGNGRTR